MVKGDHVGIDEKTATLDGIDAAEEEGEGEEVLDMELHVHGEGCAAVLRFASDVFRCAKVTQNAR